MTKATSSDRRTLSDAQEALAKGRDLLYLALLAHKESDAIGATARLLYDAVRALEVATQSATQPRAVDEAASASPPPQLLADDDMALLRGLAGSLDAPPTAGEAARLGELMRRAPKLAGTAAEAVRRQRRRVLGLRAYLVRSSALVVALGVAGFAGQRWLGARCEPPPLDASQPLTLPVGDSRVGLEGFWGVERHGERTFAWTRGRATITMRDLAPASRYHVALTLAGNPSVEVRLGPRGQVVHAKDASSTRVVAPTILAADDYGVLQLEIETPVWRPSELEPGSSDTRELGIPVVAVELEPSNP